MKIQLLSDLHVEFEDYDYPETDADVVVLAGDVHTRDRGLKWAIEHIRDKPVIYVLGNHEFYGRTYPKHIEAVKALAAGGNVHVLENDAVSIDQVNFLGCTLWTDFEILCDPRVAGYHCQERMTDFRKITKLPGYSKIRSRDVAAIHRRSRNWLARELQLRQGQLNIVVTHHAPSMQSSPEIYRDDLITSAYASNLESFIAEHEPARWLHGHIHTSSDYMIGPCRVLCNPKGYPEQINPKYAPEFCFEV
ncbi:MAG: metallophosphoesterase [Phycisphaerae bacterium]|jgi:Icc-related predicted phosphoesterase|nr:metallophosphoesterase [Phycisphaerae bacterium]